MTGNLQQKSGVISYHRFGKGPKLMVCLHGYGETGGSYRELGVAAGTEFTLLCPDLPLHGGTKWEKPGFSLTDLRSIIMGLIEQECGDTSDPFTLLGYSMGGRLALAFAENFPGDLRLLVLLAPDGLKVNPWYWLATRTLAGNRLFRYTMNHPGWLFAIMKIGLRTGMLGPGITRVGHYYLDDTEERGRLYERWMLFRNFRPNRRKKSIFSGVNNLSCMIISGRHDRIITAAALERFASGNGAAIELVLLNAGHGLLKQPFTATIADRIKNKMTG
jgi:pimeloyl-ACP methyl ester carboxylesterase